MPANWPDTTRVPATSNVVGWSDREGIGDMLIPGAATITMPPWFGERSSSARSRTVDDVRPEHHSRPITALSESCQLSTRHNTSIRRLRWSSMTSSNLFSSNRMLRQPNDRVGAHGGSEEDTAGRADDCDDDCRTLRPACLPDDARNVNTVDANS